MGDVRSPRSMFLRIWVVSSQSLKAVVRPVKNFRWASPLTRKITEPGAVTPDSDVLWFLFGNFPLLCTGYAVETLMNDLLVYEFVRFLNAILMVSWGVTHFLVFFSVYYWYRDMPFRLIGAKGKFMLEVIPVITLAALHLLLEFHYGCLTLVLGLTTYFYTFAYFMHTAYDIGGLDVLLGIVMQVVAYILDGGLLERGLGLSLCVMVCLCRYVMYRAPQVPTHSKKVLEQLPC